MSDVNKFLSDNDIRCEKIKYILSENGRTVVYTVDGETYSTGIPLKVVYPAINDGSLISITKGVVVSKKSVLRIEKLKYTMTDGKVFSGRKRNGAEHKKIRTSIRAERERITAKRKITPENLLAKCTLMNDSPIAYCIIELAFDKRGRGVDFVFRYCNEAMAVIEGVPVEKMVNRSFYEVFPDGEKKWLVTYADVALNGGRKTISDYSPEIGKYLDIHCYQPIYGYCACFLQERYEK